MRTIFLGVVLAACAGPGQQRLADTPTATTRRAPSMAPPASTDDRDRYRMNQQFEDMQDAQQAHHEAAAAEAAPPAAGTPTPAAPAAKPPVKRGHVEQAPPPAAPTK